jgi:hypothetical protein
MGMHARERFIELEHLVLLADHGHFGRAAKTGHVTQSTLSASIKELENTPRPHQAVVLLSQLAIDGGIHKGATIKVLLTAGHRPSREIVLV